MRVEGWGLRVEGGGLRVGGGGWRVSDSAPRDARPLRAVSGWQTIFRLTSWVSGTNPSTLDNSRGETEGRKAVEGLVMQHQSIQLAD